MIERRLFTPADLAQIVIINEPRISPNGAWVAFVRRTVDLFNNAYKDNIWVCATDGGPPIQLTYSNKDTSPRWSPDGSKLLFISKRGDKAQIFVLPIQAPGGEARQVTTGRMGVSQPTWSPDGMQIAYLTPLTAEERANPFAEAPKPNSPLEERHQKELWEQADMERLDPLHIWRIPYREGVRYLDGRYQQIHIIDATDPDAKPIALTDMDANHSTPQWLPDGKAIITTRSDRPNDDQPYRRNAIYRIDVETKQAMQLTGEGYSHHAPQVSPDGSQLAFYRYLNSQYFHLPRLAVMNTDGSDVRDLNLGMDRSVTQFRWQPRSDRLLAAVADSGNVELYDTLAFQKIGPSGIQVMGFDVAQDGSIAFTASSADNPSELLWLARGASVPMMSVNDALLGEYSVSPTQEIWFTGAKGNDVQGWYQRPHGYEDGQKYPMVVFIHGGPHAMWGPGSRSMWHQFQTFSAAGYVVFYCNPHGSDGYGSAFRDGGHAAWGSIPQQDIMAGVDALLRLGFVDETRLGITGGSYGGYLTAWVVAHTERFKAAVAQRGVYSLPSFYGTSDIPALMSDEFDGEPWEVPERYWQNSPLAHAHRIKTPLLLLHAENDFRVPIEQAEQLFTFVRRSGGTVELVRYPRDGHELSRSGEAKHRVDRIQRMLDWFNKYLMS